MDARNLLFTRDIQVIISPMTTHLARESATELESWQSSDVLSDDIQVRVRGLISEAVKDIDFLDRRIAALADQGDLHDLEQKKETEAARIKILRETISPFKKVPNETLHYILSHCGTGAVRLPLSARNAYPWRLGHVCSRWTNAIWNVPSLWTPIRVQVFRGGIGDRIVREPLSDIISKFNGPLELYNGGYETPAFLDFIIAFNDRFHTLSFGISSNQALYTLLELPSGSFPNLENLGLTFSRLTPPFTQFETTVFENSPKLRSVKLTNPQDIPVFELLLLPFKQLTDLSMLSAELSSDTMYSILRQTTCLVYCHLTIRSESPSTSEIPPIILSSLLLLDLTLINVNGWNHLLAPFTTPSLKELEIINHAGPFPLQMVISFIHQSQCEIHTLSINTDFSHPLVEISDQEIEALLRSTPSLILCNTGFITPPFIFKMIQNGVLLPKIKFGSWRFRPQGLDAFMDFLDSCILGSHPEQLEAVRPIRMEVGCYRGDEFETVRQRFKSRNQEYKKVEGIDVNVTTLPFRRDPYMLRIDRVEINEWQ